MPLSMLSDSNADDPRVDDLDLVRRAKRGDAEAIRRFLDRMSCVRRILAAKNGRAGGRLDENTLEDLVQDTLIVVWEKLDNFQGTGRLEAWVYRICHLNLMSKLRETGRLRSPILFDEEQHSDAAPEEHLLALRQERVYRALDRLDDSESAVVRAKCLDGNDFDTIASKSGESPAAVRSRYYRALDKLRQLLLRGRQEQDE